MLLVCADIVSRNLFSTSLSGVADYLSYAIVASVYLQLGMTIRNKRLVRATFLSDMLVKRYPSGMLLLQTIFSLAAIAVMALAVRYLWSDFADAWTEGEFLGSSSLYELPTWPFKVVVAIASTLAMLEIIAELFRCYRDQAAMGIAQNAVTFLIGAALCIGGYYLFQVMAAAGLDRMQIGIGALVALLVLISLGMPIVFAMLITSFVGIWLVRDNLAVSINSIGLSASGAVRSYGFAVIPLFVLMGLMLDKAGVGRDAFQIMATLMRRVTGGLGVATVGANAIFASITGSSIASATVFSRIAVPPMMEAGYSKKFSLGIVAGSSVLGMLIPPSLLMIVYGLLAEASIGNLFIAGILPGILLAVSFGVLIMGLARFRPSFAGATNCDFIKEDISLGGVLRGLAPVFFIVVLVMGGIYGGFFSPTEAGAAGAFGAFIVSIARRSLTWEDLRELVLETGAITAGLLFLMIAANVYGRMLSMSTIPMQTAGLIGQLDLTLVSFVLLYVVIVVVLGMILDSVSIMLIILPIALPVVTALGGDPIWFGIVTVIAIEIGLLTPPFGLSVYVVKASLPEGFASLGEIFAAAAPFVIVMALVTLLLIFVPWLTTALL
ncbi:MAG: TRAP transporter large permease subunit [Tateyamaria sp.]|nr:TRAP transporter large permease subunit [Tateyamaria sp.]